MGAAEMLTVFSFARNFKKSGLGATERQSMSGSIKEWEVSVLHDLQLSCDQQPCRELDKGSLLLQRLLEVSAEMHWRYALWESSSQ